MKLFSGKHRNNTPPRKRKPRSDGHKRIWRSLTGMQRGLILLTLSFLVLVGTVLAVGKMLIKPPDLTPEPAIFSPAKPADPKDKTPVASNPVIPEPIRYEDDKGEEVEFQFERPGSVREGFYNILLVGVDNDGTRTDTIIVARLNANDHTVAMMSIPRDTLINCNYSVPKINSVYGGNGKGEKGVNALKQQLASILGIEVNGYALVDLEAFVELVDLVGGVNFYVPQRMYYTDPTQNLYIDLYEGEQLLDGQHAMQLVRFRSYAEADIKRTAVQQDFLRALAKKCISFESIAKIKPMVEIAMEYVETDLSLGNLLYFAQELMKCDFDKMETFTLPGEGVWIRGGSYYALSPSQVQEIVNENFNPYDTDIPLSSFHIRGGGSSTPTVSSSKPVVTPAKPAVPEKPAEVPEEPELPDENETEEPEDPNLPSDAEQPDDPTLPPDTEQPVDPNLPPDTEQPVDPVEPSDTEEPVDPNLPVDPPAVTDPPAPSDTEEPVEPDLPPNPFDTSGNTVVEPPPAASVENPTPSTPPQDSGFLEKPDGAVE